MDSSMVVRRSPEIPWSGPRPATGLLSQTATELMGFSEARRPRSRPSEALAASSRSAIRPSHHELARMSQTDGFRSVATTKRSTDSRWAGRLAAPRPQELDADADANATLRPCPLSPSTQRENCRRELLEAERDKQQEAAREQKEDAEEQAPTLEMSPELFQTGIQELQDKIVDISKSLNLEHMAHLIDGNEDPAALRKREEAQRRREAEERRRRKQEQEARDPKRKIALRLENTRRFGLEPEGSNPQGSRRRKEVPTRIVDIERVKGTERVEFVDIVMMKSLCNQVDNHPSVATLLDIERAKERARRMAATAQCSLSTPDLRGDGTLKLPPATKVMSTTWEERRQAALMKKESIHVDHVMRMLNTMRNVPDSLPFRIEDMTRRSTSVSQLAQQGAASSSGAKRRKESAAMSLGGTQGTLMLDSTQSSQLQEILGNGGSRSRRVSVEGRGNLQSQDGRRRSKCKDMAQVSDKKTVARRLRWVKVRATVQWLMSLARARRRSWASDKVKTVLAAMGEWVRIKVIVRRFRSSLKMLQARCRTFIQLKHSRCALMEKEWKRVEDHHLSSFFFGYAQRMLAEQSKHQQKGRSRSKMSPQQKAMEQQLAEGLKDGQLQVDWRRFRIPSTDTRHILGRYYIYQLRNRVRMQSSFSTVVNSVVKSQREMVGFLKEFGAVPQAVSAKEFIPQVPECTPPPFYHLNEELILQMIALSATRLACAQVEPFSQHPSLQEVPGNTMYRPPLEGMEAQAAAAASGGRVGKKDALIVACRLDRAVGRLSRRKVQDPSALPSSASHRASTANALAADEKKPTVKVQVPEGSAGKKPRHIEEVLKSFTPRLREITEEQTVEYRMNPPSFDDPHAT